MTTPALLLCLLLPAQGRSCLNQTYRVQAARAQTYTSYAQSYNYAQPVQYQVQERVIWVPVEGGSNYPDSAYSAADLVGSRQRSQAIAAGRLSFQQAVIDRLDKLEGIRAELAKANQNATDPGPPIPPTGPPVVPPGQPPPNPDPNQPPPAPKPEVDPATAAQWTNDAVAVLQNRCAKCHSSSATARPKGDFTIFGPDGKLALTSPLDLSAIGEQTRYLKMPKGGALSDEEQSKLDNWIGLHLDEINAARRAVNKAKAPAVPSPPLPASAPPPPIVPGATRQ
jgi:hypothetical protein